MTQEYEWIKCSIVDYGIVHTVYKENLVVDLEIARDLVSSRFNFTGGKPHLLLLDITGVKRVSNEAKDYLQREDAGLKNIIGAAFLVNTPLSMLLADIFTRPVTKFPVRIFTDKEKAISWLKNVSNKSNNTV